MIVVVEGTDRGSRRPDVAAPASPAPRPTRPQPPASASTQQNNILNNLTQFQKKQSKGFIDVWWLYDDGGMYTLILLL